MNPNSIWSRSINSLYSSAQKANSMKTPDKKEYTESGSKDDKARYQSLLDQGMEKDMAWNMVYNEPDSNQPYENWPKAELENLAAKQGIKDYESKTKEELIEELNMQ